MAETARENQVGSAAVKYETVADMGSGLVIAKVKLTDFREQDINARIMKTEMQKQLTDNIKKRGQLESLPFCALIDGKIEIISGHHRIRSAKDSGVLTELFVILDTTGLRRSQVAAKQLAHNAISGFDDQSTLKEIAKMIDDVDDMLESTLARTSSASLWPSLRSCCPRRWSSTGRTSRSPSCRTSSAIWTSL